MAGPYDIGDLVRMRAGDDTGAAGSGFKDAAGAAADPTTVKFKLEKPDGSELTYVYLTNAELVKDGVGVYHVDFAPTAAGWHTYRFEGTGAVQAAEERSFFVRASAF